MRYRCMLGISCGTVGIGGWWNLLGRDWHLRGRSVGVAGVRRIGSGCSSGGHRRMSLVPAGGDGRGGRGAILHGVTATWATARAALESVANACPRCSYVDVAGAGRAASSSGARGTSVPGVTVIRSCIRRPRSVRTLQKQKQIIFYSPLLKRRNRMLLPAYNLPFYNLRSFIYYYYTLIKFYFITQNLSFFSFTNFAYKFFNQTR